MTNMDFGVENLVEALFLKLLKKPVEDLTKEFQKLRKNKKFIKKRDYYFKNYIGLLLHL